MISMDKEEEYSSILENTSYYENKVININFSIKKLKK